MKPFMRVVASGRRAVWRVAVWCAAVGWAGGGAAWVASAQANQAYSGADADAGVVSAAQWGSVPPPTSAYRSRRQEAITGLTVHHQGEIWQASSDVAAYLRRLQQWSRRERAWVDVPYHYIVAPDGRVYAGRDPQWAGDSNTDYDTMGQLQVMLLGNFEVQQPSPAQLQSTARLLGHLLALYGLAPGRIQAHRHHTTQTVCPGERLMLVFEELRGQAAALRAKDHLR